MSINCQYDTLRYPFYLQDYSKRISVETVLPLPENAPRLQTVVGGDFLAEPPQYVVGEDVITISGLLHPYLVYLTKEEALGERRRRDDAEDREDDANDNVAVYLPREHGLYWREDEAVFFEETVALAGIRPETHVEVDIVAVAGVFERDNEDRVVARIQIDITIHARSIQTAGVVGDLAFAPPDRCQVSKEQVKVEEPVGTRQERMAVQAPLLLPNLKPGMDRVVRYGVRPSGVSCDVSRGKIVVKGFLDISLIYVGSDDDGQPTEVFLNDWSRSAGNGLPFETSLDFEGITDTDIVIPRITVARVDLDRTSHRELRASIKIEVEVSVSRVVTREMVTEVSASGNELIDTQKYLFELEEYSGEATGELDLDLNVNLPFGIPGMDRLLGWRGAPNAVKVEAGDGKIMLEGLMNLQLYYMADSGDDSRLAMSEWGFSSGNELPIAGLIDFPGIAPGVLLRTHLSLESLNLEMTGERMLRLTGEIRVRAFGRTPRAMMMLRDCALVLPVDPATRPSMLFYVAQPGDTLWKVARRYETTVETLVRANQVVNQELLEAGQKLIIPKIPVAAG